MDKRDRKALNEEKVIEIFGTGIDCGQVVVDYFAKKYNFDSTTCLKLASSFGAGIFKGSMCGAYIGGLMAIGMIYGHSKANDMDAKVRLIEKISDYDELYKMKYSSEVCEDLLGGNLMEPESNKKIEENGLISNFCPKLVLDVIDFVEGLE